MDIRKQITLLITIYKLLLNLSTHKDNWENHDPEIDIFLNQFVDLKPYSKYCDIYDFHQLKNKLNYERCFSVIHSNICSLQANSDGLESFLCDLEFKVDVVSLSETWNPENEKHHFIRSKIEGYRGYFGTNGSSAKGGCGFCINDALNKIPRNYLNTKSKVESHEFESCWVEIIKDKEPNILLGVFVQTSF